MKPLCFRVESIEVFSLQAKAPLWGRKRGLGRLGGMLKEHNKREYCFASRNSIEVSHAKWNLLLHFSFFSK